MAACRAREWSWDGPARAMCQARVKPRTNYCCQHWRQLTAAATSDVY